MSANDLRPTRDLRERLRRLGVKQGREGLTPSPKSDLPGLKDPAGLPGKEITTDLGPYFLIETSYALDHEHGPRTLGDFVGIDSHTAAHLSRDEAFVEADVSKLAFLDIETTGLVGGAGTLAFLVGLGFLEDDHFTLRQYFLRDPAEEKAMLSGLAETLKERSGLVTYNGRAFDVPIVQARFTMSFGGRRGDARRRFDLGRYPHLDLLPPARRLWRGRYENCSLGTLERAVLGLERTAEDMPGALIPQLYVHYLHTGETGDMKRVIYHNAEDILSMVTLSAHILDTFAGKPGKSRSGVDSLRLALWHDDLAHTIEADSHYRAALARPLPDDQALVAYKRYAAFLKGVGRQAQAVEWWRQWADLDASDPTPCIELAKYYEWETKEIARAREWASQALLCLAHWKKGWQRDEAWKEIQHRLERLGRKK
jgi:hypothetical protein